MERFRNNRSFRCFLPCSARRRRIANASEAATCSGQITETSNGGEEIPPDFLFAHTKGEERCYPEIINESRTEDQIHGGERIPNCNKSKISGARIISLRRISSFTTEEETKSDQANRAKARPRDHTAPSSQRGRLSGNLIELLRRKQDVQVDD